ncbi:MAG: type II secretion system F family protein [Candidatus Bathyarchaeia archaeon]|jgi:flagellar protein FlaJ
MKTAHTLLERVKTVFNRLKARLRPPAFRMPSNTSDNPQAKIKLTLGSLQTIAYELFGEKTGRILPLFKDLDTNLQRSGMRVNFKAYVTLTMFCTISLSLAILTAVPCLLFFLLNVALIPAILFGLGGSLLAIAFTTIGFYGYPIYRADTTKRQLEDELPFTTGYMAILTSAGVSSEKIFSSLADLPVDLAISTQAKDVVRDVNLFGRDIISALEDASKRTPSERFREMIEGFISMIHSGGNVASYMREKSAQYMKLKRIGLKKYADTLSMLSEFYVTILLTGPLMLVIMLTVMDMLGNSSLGFLSPDFLLSLLTYVGIPLGSVIFLILLDATSPKW